MTGRTHRVGGMVCCFLGYSVLKSKGLLVGNVNPLLQLTVMYPFALWGSTMPDLDHHAESAPSKDIVSVAINRVLHLTTIARKVDKKVDPIGILDAKHRSWQTHSDLFLAIFLYLLYSIMNLQQSMDTVILRIVLMGFILGVIAHMVLDMLTPEGIWSFLFILLNKIFNLKLPEKIHFVPKKKFFATDGPWEKLVRNFLWLINILYLFVMVLEISPYQINFRF